MKRAVLLDRLEQAARRGGLEFRFDRHGGNHDLFLFGARKIAIPRHREVRERTAQSILRACERERGDQA